VGWRTNSRLQVHLWLLPSVNKALLGLFAFAWEK
jgi:hypothetical protein